MKITVDDHLLETFKDFRIFHSRTGMSGLHQKPNPRFIINDNLNFSKSCLIENYSTIAAGFNLFSVGAFSSVASSFGINDKIGRYASIGAGVRRVGFRHPVEAVCMNSAVFNFNREYVHSYFNDYEYKEDLNKIPVELPQPQNSPIVIGNDVWVGNNVTLSGGIFIGDGSVIASGSLVTHNVLPYTIVGGVPAREIRMRFPSDISQEFLKIKWWEYELGDFYRNGINFNDPELFLKRFYAVKDEIRRISVRTFSPLNYKFYKDAEPRTTVITHHDTALVYAPKEKKLTQLDGFYQSEFEKLEYDSSNNLIRTPLGKILSVDVSGKYILEDVISPSNLVVEEVSSGIAIKNNISGKYISAHKTGGVVESPKCDAWEIYYIT